MIVIGIMFITFCLILYCGYKIYKWIKEILNMAEEFNKELSPLLDTLKNANTAEEFINSYARVNDYLNEKVGVPCEGIATIRLSEIDEVKLKENFEQYKSEYIDDMKKITFTIKLK